MIDNHTTLIGSHGLDPWLAKLCSIYIRYPITRCPCGSRLTLPHDSGLPTSPEMDTKIIYTHPSSGCTVLVNESTGQKLYKIQTARRFVGSITKVFRYDNAAPSVPNLMPPTHSDINEPHEGHSSEDVGTALGRSGEENENEGESSVVGTGGEASVDNLHLAENEIARFYWKWFASARMVFEGKVQRRAEYMPFGDKLKL